MARLRINPEAEDILDKSEFIIEKDQVSSPFFSRKLYKNNNKIILEIGMGKGKFILEQAILHQNINYLGIEKSATILLQAINKLLRYNQEHKVQLKTLKFLKMDASELDSFFPLQSVEGIYLNFSDPWPKSRHQKRRLVYKDFLDKYFNILKANGFIEFKTDQEELYEFALSQINEFTKFKILELEDDLHQIKNDVIMTEYEDKFSKLGHKIYYLKLIKKEEE